MGLAHNAQIEHERNKRNGSKKCRRCNEFIPAWSARKVGAFGYSILCMDCFKKLAPADVSRATLKRSYE